MINYIFGLFIIIGVIYGAITGNISNVNDAFFSGGDNAIEMSIKMSVLLCLWLGVMRIADSSGLIYKVSNLFKIIVKFIFPDIKHDDKSIGYISSSIVMNMLGLGSAATPMGLKAIASMQEVNDKKDIASRSMITFLVINTASVTVIPTTVISLRTLNKSSNPTEIVLACIIVTFLSLVFGLILDRIFYYIWKCYYE